MEKVAANYCLNKAENMELFHAEVSQLSRTFKYRSDHTGLWQLLENDPEYRHLDGDALEAVIVLLKLPVVWENREMVVNKKREREEYNMCYAVREWEVDALEICE